MSTNNSSKDEHGPKCGNPYTILKVPNFASTSQIKKAFRKLSLQLHPDKRKPNLTKAEHDALDIQFMQVNEAKEFLLEEEHRSKKEKYDLKLKSDLLRMERNKEREEAMGATRKNFKRDLQQKIERELMAKKNKFSKSAEGNHDYTHPSGSMDVNMEGLKKAGSQMKQEYAQKMNNINLQTQKSSYKTQKQLLQNRQVRVKWSRAKMGGQSEHMIADLLSKQFGPVENVELIGRKGNAALVTFLDPSSCQPCVQHYANSDRLRATYVGQRKKDHARDSDDDGDDYDPNDIQTSIKRERDRESLDERKLRQEAEREKILRQMESGSFPDNDDATNTTTKQSTPKKSLFPPLFPAVESNKRQKQQHGHGQSYSYLERLEEMERIILKDLVPPDLLRESQITTTTTTHPTS